MSTRMYRVNGNKQRGATLIVALVILLIMGMSAASILKSTTLQHKMAGNLVDNTIAFHAAEDALIDLERWLIINGSSQATTKYVTGMNQPAGAAIYSVSDPESDGLKQLLIDSDDLEGWLNLAFGIRSYTSKDELSKSAQMTMGTIEKVGGRRYRIIVRNPGASGIAEVILESIVII